MERRRLGDTDMQVSVLGFGGSEIGYQRVSGRTVARLLGGALDAGLNVIDTAECYENSEELIGKAISGRRRDFYLFSKCGHGRGYGHADWRPAALLSSIERSLRRLRTDVLDLIQLHSCSLEHLKKGDVVAALERARERGWTRYIGYSGDGEAARYAMAARGVYFLMAGPTKAPSRMMTPITKHQARPACQAATGLPVLRATGSMMRKTTMNMWGTLGP